MTVTVVGIDVLFRVQSRDLMSLKLEQGRVTVDQRAVTRISGEHQPFLLCRRAGQLASTNSPA